jgi:2,3-bisphosphoglycerate-dependent phosphoglycerate mutase
LSRVYSDRETGGKPAPVKIDQHPERQSKLKFYFIRHGQSTNNAKFAREGTQFDRHADPPMTDLGVKQAQILAEFLFQAAKRNAPDPPDQEAVSDFGFTHLYSSLMIRAVQTAEILGKKLGLQPLAWPETHERGGIYLADPDSGEPVGLAGNPREHFQEQHPDLKLPGDLGPDGWWGRPYESREQSRARAQTVIDQLLDRHGVSTDHVALVSHGGFFQELIAAALDIPSLGDHWIMLHNTGMARLDYSDGAFIVQYINRLDWLPLELVS